MFIMMRFFCYIYFDGFPRISQIFADLSLGINTLML
jgi:hypothetical protein